MPCFLCRICPSSDEDKSSGERSSHILVGTSLLREGTRQIDKLITNEKLLSYKRGGIEVDSRDDKKGKNCRINMAETKFRNMLTEIQE